MHDSSQLVWNPFRRGYRENPYETLRLFREQNPIHRGINGYWYFFKFDDVKFLLTSPAFKTIKLSERLREKNHFLKPPANFDALAQMVNKWLFLIDPPEHTELRSLVVKLWNQYQIQDFIRETVAEAVDRMKAKSAVEIIEDFAGFVPTRTISRILGFPVEDYEQLRRWSRYFANTFEPFEPLPALLRYNENARAVTRYVEDVMARKKSAPDASFISRFQEENARLERPVSHENLVSLFVMLFFAGMETSIYFFGHGIYALMQNPAQTQILRDDLSLVPKAVEELVRFVSPLQYVFRVASEDVEVKGHRIKAGEFVLGSLASANRDEAVFERADELDFTRKAKSHLSFGHGIHHCIGAKLARDEMSAALPALLTKFRRIEFDPERPHEWDNVIVFRRLNSLPAVLV